MKKEVFQLGKISETINAKRAPISTVTRGGLVFVSGLPPFDPATGELVRGDIRVQTRRCLENLKATLYAEYFREDPPARTFVTVGARAQPFDIEFEAVALA